jgi:hypothetical protein
MKALNLNSDPKTLTKEFVSSYIALQTFIGLKFIDKKDVVYFQYGINGNTGKNQWVAHLKNTDSIKLKANVTSKDILKHFAEFHFVQVNQNNIINLNYLDSIELKSRKCIIPYNSSNKELTISRTFLKEIRLAYEME